MLSLSCTSWDSQRFRVLIRDRPDQQARMQSTVFRGNKDRSSVVAHVLRRPFHARFVRIEPLTSHQGVAMRCELFGSDALWHSNPDVQNGAVRTCDMFLRPYKILVF